MMLNSAFLLAFQEGFSADQITWQTLVKLGLLIALGIFSLVILALLWAFGKLWFQAFMSRADVTMTSLVGMYFRQVRMPIIVNAKIMACQAGLDIGRRDGISTQRLEAHYLAGGNVMNVMQAIIAANRAGIDLDFDKAAAIDLAGRDVLDAVRTSVHPKVIDCPDPKRSGKTTLSAIARDGVELRVRTRVTVRTNLEQLIGGATEETIIARVGESIISSIGSADNHLVVLENPDLISRAVLKRGLDAQTLFRSYRSTSLISTWVKTSVLACERTKPKPILESLVPKPNNAALKPSQPSKS